jgi:hypothetical protein
VIDTSGVGDWTSFSLDEAPVPLPAAAAQVQAAPAVAPMAMPMQQPMMPPVAQQPMRPQAPPAAPYVHAGGILSQQTLPSPDQGWSLGMPLAPPEPSFGQPAFGQSDPVGVEGHTLGLSLLLASIGTGLGMYWGGAFGGLAGAAMGGGLVNVYRAVRYVMVGTPAADREALISGTYAVISLGAGGYLAYRVSERRSTKSRLGASL